MADTPVRTKRSLNQLLSSLQTTPMQAVTNTPSDLQYISIQQIQPGKYQPRKEIDPTALEELATSIRSQGILQPIVLRAIADQQYELIAGERRWRAAKLAGLEIVPAIIKEANDENTMALALIENIQREDLNPMEESIALQRLIDECGLTHQQVADAVGKPRVTISNLLRLGQLNSDVKNLLAQGDIELGHAKVLLGVEGSLQSQAAVQVALKKLSVRQTEQLIQKLSSNPTEKSTFTNPNLLTLEKDLQDRLNTNVKIIPSTKNRGKLVIHYQSVNALNDILARMK